MPAEREAPAVSSSASGAKEAPVAGPSRCAAAQSPKLRRKQFLQTTGTWPPRFSASGINREILDKP